MGAISESLPPILGFCTSLRLCTGLRAAAIHRNLPANHPWNAAGHGVSHLPGNTAGHGSVFRFADPFTDRVRNLTSTLFVLVGTNCVRNLFGAAFRFHRTDGVRYLSGNALFFICAGDIRHLFGARLIFIAANRVRNSSRMAFGFPAAGHIGNPLGGGAGNRFANRIRNSALLHFPNHSRAADLTFDGFGTPYFSTDRSAGTLYFFCPAFPRHIDAAATLLVPFPGSRITHTLFHHGTGDVFGNSLPFPAFDLNGLGLRHRSTNRVADVPVTGLPDGLVGGAGHISITSFVNRFTNRIDAIPVACFVLRFADRVTDVAITGLVDRFADLAGQFPVTCLVTGYVDGVRHIAIAGLIHRPADGVTLIAIAGFVDIAVTRVGNLFTNRVIDGFGTCEILFLPDHFANGFVARSAGLLRRTIVTC